ncbi:hypothetical protein [Klebsiella aerogenes]|uniref:hypothetical protein n=1 Tax=Klebsiella aerogenes TaxID=548 RepID=UPI000B0FA32A|nr:hypothetical protein [Klebsiella aerogenes]
MKEETGHQIKRTYLHLERQLFRRLIRQANIHGIDFRDYLEKVLSEHAEKMEAEEKVNK